MDSKRISSHAFKQGYDKNNIAADENQAIEISAAGMLPPDLWELIASKMPAKEWGKARGTCRAMLKARRTVLQLAPVSTEELMWTLIAVPDVKKLWLDITRLTKGVSSASSFRKVWEDNNTGMQHCYLQQLCLIMSGDDICQEAPFLYYWKANIAAVLAMAMDLVTLRLDVPAVPTLPLMTKLEHVNIIVCQPLKKDTCKWLQRLPSLQTLSMEKCPQATAAAAFMIPPLDLSTKAHLKAVSLFHIIPEQFSAPAQCSVTLWTDAQTLRSRWANVYASSCTACTVFMARPVGAFNGINLDLPDLIQMGIAADYNWLASSLSPALTTHVPSAYFGYILNSAWAPNLTMLRIEVPSASLGQYTQPLQIDHNLPHLRAFRCRARDIFLEFGRNLRLESLRGDAEYALRFCTPPETPGAFWALLCSLKYMHLLWGYSVHGSAMHQLMEAFRKAGYICNVQTLDYGPIEAKYCDAAYTPIEEEKLCLGCGACGICLNQKHGITDIFGLPASTRFRRGISP